MHAHPQTGQQGHIMSEKRVMISLNHPFLIRLYSTYKDKNRLFFLLEPSLGGELFSVLRARTLFDEDTARYCVVRCAVIQLCCAFAHLVSALVVVQILCWFSRVGVRVHAQQEHHLPRSQA